MAKPRTTWIGFGADWESGEWFAFDGETAVEAKELAWSEYDGGQVEGLIKIDAAGNCDLVRYKDARGRPQVLASTAKPIRLHGGLQVLGPPLRARDYRALGEACHGLLSATGIPKDRIPRLVRRSPSTVSPPPVQAGAKRVGCLGAVVAALLAFRR